jgi:NADPH:quinone reductase-like Zn-dependent oxidoreductase
VGEVAELGPGVTGFEIGERVVPMTAYPAKEEVYAIIPRSTAPSSTITGIGTWGTYAQYMEMPAHWVLKDDSSLKPEELATMPMVMFTSVRAIKVVGQVKPGDKLLIHAGVLSRSGPAGSNPRLTIPCH